ncbi:MAG: sugar transferase [Candidatus Doudnabacteria bacterium]|nr:sugar transferase [bacterium]MDZ4243485.1 sugar transferase [Candidatus Doudnabacteria bacterium]
MPNRFKKIMLVAGDILLLFSALWLTLLIRYWELPSRDNWLQNLSPFTVLFAVWLLVFYISGLYDIVTSRNDIGFYNRIIAVLLINYGLATAYFYLLTDKLFDIKPQTVFFVFIAVYTVLFSLWRYWYNGFVSRPTHLRKVLVLGINDEAKELINEINQKPQLGYRIAAIIHDGYLDQNDFPGIIIYNGFGDLKKLLREHHIGTVVTALDPRSAPKFVEQLYESLSLRLEFRDLPAFYEKLTGKIPVTTIGHIWFLENLVESEKDVYEFFKRLFDILFASLALVASLPLFPLIVLLIKFNDGGGIFFKQLRTGHLSRRFVAIKFRSMIADAEKDGKPQWATNNDPRVTKIGRMLRKMRLDEIPQFWNILRGEMTLVGPRPERPELVKDLLTIIPFYNERHLVKPGLTGWAQINFQYGASAKDAFKKLQYDLFYVKNRSFALDIGIILKTINIILSGKGQ